MAFSVLVLVCISMLLICSFIRDSLSFSLSNRIPPPLVSTAGPALFFSHKGGRDRKTSAIDPCQLRGRRWLTLLIILSIRVTFPSHREDHSVLLALLLYHFASVLILAMTLTIKSVESIERWLHVQDHAWQPVLKA